MKLIDISGIGKAREQYFNELGITTPEDLISYTPYKYYDFSKTEPFADDGKVRLIKSMVIENAKIIKTRSNLSFVSCKMADEIGHNFYAIWYNQTYVKNQLYLGAELYLFGKNSPTKKNNFIVQIAKFTEKIKKLGLLPVYKTSNKIGQTIFKNSIDYILQNLKFSTFIPNELLYKYNLCDINLAYNLLHNPTTESDIILSQDRIEIERLIPLIAAGEFHKSIFKIQKLHKYNNFIKILEDFENLLPYKLTFEQKTAIREISNDMLSGVAMNRILQGDVGAGKTAVAFFAAYLAAKNNHQSVIIAPTEILAVQHYENAKKLFKDIEIVLFTGSAKGETRTINLKKIKSGEAKIIIGTHALLSDNVDFSDLTFITIDEQHRFGVEQRKKLKSKGFSPDILVMSATPIPRTLSLVIYGDLDISIINSRPKTYNISTNIVMKQKQNDMWNFIKNKINNGSKAYVVCSKIDEQLDDDELMQFSAKSMFNTLSEKFSDKIGLIHGKLSKEAQNNIILRFKTGDVRLLVSTTVVEVGMDIPDADIIVIATPERFGLATLHQLRGRVGRNGQESYCFCLGNNLNEKSYNRLKFFKENSNGFKIAEYDLDTRGAGSIIGTNQHGKSFGLTFSSSNYSTAKQILEKIKLDPIRYTKILEKGEEVYNSSILSKVILN